MRLTLLAAGLLLLAACDNSNSTEANAPAPASETVAAEAAASDTPVDLALLASDAGWAPASVAPTDGKVTLNTHNGLGGFSAMVNLPETSRKSGPGHVHVTLTPSVGAIQMFVIAQADASKLYTAQFNTAATGASETISLPVEDMSNPMALLLANGSATGPSTAVIESIHITQP